MDLEFILEKNLKEIIRKYASYVDCLCSIIEEKGVSPKSLRLFLLSLPVSTRSYQGQKLTLLSDKKDELEEAKTITDIFIFLTTEWASFLNYDIFQDIIKNYNISEDQERLKYPEHLKAYIEKHKISEFVKINPLLKQMTGSKELVLKCDIENTCRLAKLVELKKVVAEILDINPSTLHIVDIKDGCIVVTFLLPASVANAIFTPDTVFTPQQKDELRAASVLWLECNGYTLNIKDEDIHMCK